MTVGKSVLESIAVLVFGGVSLLAQSGSSMKAPEFDHKAVPVSDIQKSTDFYVNVLGLQVIPDPFHDGRHVFLRVGQNEQLHLIGGEAKAEQHVIGEHVAFRVQSLKDFMIRLDQMHIAYRSYDGKAKVGPRPDGVHQLYLQDPDGYWIEVNDAKY
jgi:lactoylglutathione lyase